MWDRCSRSGGSIDEICCIIGGADKAANKTVTSVIEASGISDEIIQKVDAAIDGEVESICSKVTSTNTDKCAADAELVIDKVVKEVLDNVDGETVCSALGYCSAGLN